MRAGRKSRRSQAPKGRARRDWQATIRRVKHRPEASCATDAPHASDTAAAPQPAAALAAAAKHYENFPVASLLCPAHLRPPVAAIYAFARTADDIADEGQAGAASRLADLAAYHADLQAIAQGRPASPRWPGVFVPLRAALRSQALPVAPLADLLSAFAQDVRKTQAAEGYADRAELLDYCRRSANPVGRLLLHLYGFSDARALAESDAICTALQLINCWQDLSVDLPRGRHYLPRADCTAHGVDPARLRAQQSSPEIARLIADCALWARACMQRGAPLVQRLPGRAGWELRLAVQGGLRVLDKVQSLQGAILHTRPRLQTLDWCLMLCRAAMM